MQVSAQQIGEGVTIYSIFYDYIARRSPRAFQSGGCDKRKPKPYNFYCYKHTHHNKRASLRYHRSGRRG